MTKTPALFPWLPARHRVGKVVIALGVAVISFQFPAEANLLINPSFESGNTGFTSDYAYFAPGSPGNMDDGRYSVVQSLNQVHAIWAGAGSLSAQSGTNYLVANGASSAALSPWLQTISVVPGGVTVTGNTNAPVYYRFEAYIASVYGFGTPQPQLAFEMSLNNSGIWQELTTSTVPDDTNTWYLTYRDGYFLSAPSTISFRLRNTVTAEGGNDFAVDSLYFGLSTNSPSFVSDPTGNAINSVGAITGGAAVPEPGTWAAAALLAGGATFLRWRRRRDETQKEAA